ncbi:uncharacterized protein CLUP02_02664 [Colletotrichum lupini]|uniref:Uncharacterized protein n=1 Tax=Colletotrichum lupini TaxID=145971 RepID=A0A9Q8WC00_9PEZI|nr:uncharacterized protein CLUP02_02664 [Colletotrichum lupini]UQC77197.1 hypothetical protein CLUP02_02664 [Colletotrichum lupini]
MAWSIALRISGQGFVGLHLLVSAGYAYIHTWVDIPGTPHRRTSFLFNPRPLISFFPPGLMVSILVPQPRHLCISLYAIHYETIVYRFTSVDENPHGFSESDQKIAGSSPVWIELIKYCLAEKTPLNVIRVEPTIPRKPSGHAGCIGKASKANALFLVAWKESDPSGSHVLSHTCLTSLESAISRACLP